jgi:hypothetical protein
MVRRHGGLCKVLDLLPHHRDASLVGGVEFEDAGTVELGTKQLLAERENGGRFSRSWRSVKEHVRELQRSGSTNKVRA